MRTNATVCAALLALACENAAPSAREPATALPAPIGEGEVVFESVRVLDGSDEVATETRGALSVDVWQRAARPWTYLDEPYVYHEQTWERQREDGTFEQGYRVVRATNGAHLRTSTDEGPPELGAGVAERANEPGDAAVILRFASYPHWNVPLVPPAQFAEHARAQALAARAASIEARRGLFAERVGRLRGDVERTGGTVFADIGWSSGYVLVRMPARALPSLFARRDLSRIDLVHGEAESGLFNPIDGTTVWNLGDARWATRTGADRFLADGIAGGSANDSRHAYGRIAVAMIENDLFEDEACFFSDGESCTGPSRILSRASCEGTSPTEDPCRYVTDFDDVDDVNAVFCCTDNSQCTARNPDWQCVAGAGCGAGGRFCICVGPRCARHATIMAGTISADYRQHQCDCLSCGDDACAAGCIHNRQFADRATGMAPEVGMLLWANTARDLIDPLNHEIVQARSFAHAMSQVRDSNADLVNNSWVWRDANSICDEVANLPFELEAEDAVDDGVFVLSCSGNTPSTTGCDVATLGTLPKTFTVSGTPTTRCPTNYSDCVVLPSAGSEGGIPIVGPDGPHANAMTAIGLVAPTGNDYATVEVGDTGEVDDNPSLFRTGGCSVATAHMSGLAALVKNDHLARGLTWINSPGRMHLVMLSMGDRGYDDQDNQRAIGGDNNYGFGRVRLRRVDDFSQRATTTYSLTANSPQRWSPFAVPLAADTNLVKCVLLQEEDMSSKTTISSVDMSVIIQPPDSSGLCWPTAGTAIAQATDSSFDVKSLVAFEHPTTALRGNCVNVVITPVALVDGAATVHALCYASRFYDDENAGACTADVPCDGGVRPCDTASGALGPCSAAPTVDPNACETAQLGVCRSGTSTCNGTSIECTPNMTASTEICDTLDNDCDGEVDEITLTDPLNCGACGNVCSFPNAGASCVAGTCTMGACSEGFGDCDERAGCETSLTTIRDCGGCGALCTPRNATGDCSTGTCAIGACDDGWGDCTSSPGCETSLDTLTDCGACGTPCSIPNASAECASGTCTLTACDEGFGDCDASQPGCETSLETLTDCGACGAPCSLPNASTECASGTCTLTACDEGFGDCDASQPGCETELTTTTDCGACGNACAGACVDGSCQPLGVDAGGVDAGTRTDAGRDAGQPGTDSGPDAGGIPDDENCGCRTAGDADGPPVALLAGLFLLFARRRRRA